MATNYSLICFGGRAGRSVTASSTTDYITLSSHGFRGSSSSAVAFKSGTLPTVASGAALAVDTAYYPKYISSSTFELYRESSRTTKIDFTSNGSSLVMYSAYWATLAAGSGGTGRTRYGTAGSERVFDGLLAWQTDRVTTNPPAVTDIEVCEICDSYSDIATSVLSLNVAAASTTITTTVNGSRSEGFHNGTMSTTGVPNGYIFDYTGAGDTAIHFNGTNHTIDGISVATSGASKFNAKFLQTTCVFATVTNCILYGYGSTSGSVGLYDNNASLFTFTNNIIHGLAYGAYFDSYYAVGSLVANNLVVKCTNGMYMAGTGTGNGSFYNNISIGNTTNWSTYSSTYWYGAAYNVGASGNTPWYKGTNTGVTMATTDFTDYTNYDFTHKSSGAHTSADPSVDAGQVVTGMPAYDIVGHERPAYNNGATEYWDCGPFEFDFAYTRPVVRNLNFTGLQTGSQVVVYTTSTTTELHRTSSTAGSTDTYDYGSDMTVDYTIMKAGYVPIRVTGVALSTTDTNIAIQQTLDRAYSASSGLTFGTDFVVNVSSRVVTSLQITKATTVQNWYCAMIEAWIASSTNTTLKNVAFPVATFGEASFSLLNGIEFSDGATSIAYLSRDGLRYCSDGGSTATAIYAAILTLDTAAGIQVKYRQSTSGSIVNAANTGPMDQLVKVYGDSSHGNIDYRGHMVLRAPKPGYTQPKPDLVATYGNLQDGLYVASVGPVLQYACTNADLDAAHLALDNTAKTYVVSASHTGADLYQRAQWWANQDAQWDSDIPLTTVDGSTFTLYTGWTLSGLNYVTSGTYAGGTCTLAGPGTYSAGFSGNTVQAQGEGTYTFTATNITLETTPTADDVHYVLSNCTFTGTLTVHNQNAHPIVVEVPSGTTTSSTGNTGGAITFSAPVTYQSVTVTGATSGSRIQIYDTTSSTELYNGTPTFPYTWTDSVAASATRAIRLRVAWVSGTSAKNFIDANIGTCATSGSGKDISYLVSQTDDATYNANAIDGSTVTGITIAPSPARVSINLSGGTTISNARIYAYQVYWLSRATGIADEAAFISAPDSANYIYTGFSWKNTSVTTLTITGGFPRDSSTGLSSTLIDTTGGNICVAVEHAIQVNIGGSALLTAEHDALMALPTAAQILAAAAAAPIAADIKKVAGTTITGSGTAQSPWGP